MALAHKKAGFERTKFNDKSLKQKAKILEKHYNNLGYKVPQYIINGNMNSKQFNNAINKIQNGYDTRVFKEQLTKKKINHKTIDKQLEKTVDMFNNRVNKVLEVVKKEHNLSELELRYLQGEQVQLTLRKKSFMKDEDKLEKLSLENHFFKGIKEKVDYLNKLKREVKQMSPNSYLRRLKNTTKIDNWFSNMLDEKFLDGLDFSAKEMLMNYFNKLSPIQKELVVKGELGELRERYKQKHEVDGIDDDGANFWNRTLYAIEQVYLETTGNRFM